MAFSVIHLIRNLQHPVVKHLVKLRENKRYRYENNRVVVTGHPPIMQPTPAPVRPPMPSGTAGGEKKEGNGT